MPIVFSKEADDILSCGIWLGPNNENWALTKLQALQAVHRLRDGKLVLLGGDVLNGPDKGYSPTYANWYYQPSIPPNHSDVISSSAKAMAYIESYPAEDVYFVLVPKEQ